MIKSQRGSTITDVLIVLMIIFTAAVAIFCLPLIAIWSVNKLFPVAEIGYTLGTWAASFWLIVLFGANIPLSLVFKVAR